MRAHAGLRPRGAFGVAPGPVLRLHHQSDRQPGLEVGLLLDAESPVRAITGLTVEGIEGKLV